MEKLCKCGCGKKLRLPKSKVPLSYLENRNYIVGHRKGNTGKFKEDVNKRAYHLRARNSIDVSKCYVNNKVCNGCIDVAHIDQNHKNNNIENLKALCRSHHWILDKHFKDGLRFENLKNLKVEFVVSSNKRRYKKIIW